MTIVQIMIAIASFMKKVGTAVFFVICTGFVDIFLNTKTMTVNSNIICVPHRRTSGYSGINCLTAQKYEKLRVNQNFCGDY